jgi:transposase
MEALLTLYAQAYDPCFPVVCFDERPCFLLGDVVEGLAPQPAQPGKAGQVAKQHYTYSKHGSCCVLAAVEPLTGQRLYQVRSQRTKREYTQFMQQLAARYPQAAKIRLVQDNLNTHALSTFYDCLPAAMAEKLAARFEVHYTPKCGSWLNQIELDFSALSRQCLKRRIPTQARLAYQVYCWSRQRQAQGVKIRWQFTVTQARQTLNSQYCKVNRANRNYVKTS